MSAAVPRPFARVSTASTPPPAASNAFAGRLFCRKAALTSAARVLCASLAFVFAPALAAQSAAPDVRTLLQNYARAMSDQGTAKVERLETAGTFAGAGLHGTFHTWIDGARERDDQFLGPRSEHELRIGERAWLSSDGNLRELTGVLLRRARTERFIDSGDFADAPERCVVRGRTKIGGRTAYELDVAAEGGETQTLYLDAHTGLPRRLSYDDDDGRTTVDYSDWRTIAGRRFAFKAVASDGDHAFDTVQVTTSIAVGSPIDQSVFAPLVGRRIEMNRPQVLQLTYADGHVYAPVTIEGRTFNFLLDTGAQNTVLDRRVAQELGLVEQGALEASGAARTGGARVARLPELDVGAGKLRDLVVTTIDLGASTSGAFRIDGILGFPFFAAAAVRIDLANRTMTFGPPGSLTEAGEEIPLETDRSLPEAHLRVNGNTDARFIIDTGNAAELLLYRPFVEAHPNVVAYSATNRRSYGIGGATSSYRTILDELDFGSIPMYRAETDVMLATRGAFADRFDAGNVGLGLLKNFVVTLDEAAGALYLERSAAFDDGRDRD
jgi:predicted aspartyl protease